MPTKSTAVVLSLLLTLVLALGAAAQVSAPPAPETKPGAAPGAPAADGSTAPKGSDQPAASTPPATPPAGMSQTDKAPGATTPGQPGATSQDQPGTTTTPSPVPGTPARPSDEARSEHTTIFGLTQTTALVLGAVVVAIVIGLIAMSGRRERDVIVDERIETRRVSEPPVGTYESEIERERRRRAS